MQFSGSAPPRPGIDSAGHVPSEPLPNRHGLLVRQLRRSQLSDHALDPAVRGLLGAVSSAYHDFDSIREMLERSLDLSSQELMRANAALRAMLAERCAAAKEMESSHAERLEATGLLAGGVAHDFNNLLSLIKSSCDVLRKLGDPGGVRVEVVEQIEEATERATTLTRQLLAFSRGQVLEPRLIDLNRTISGLEHICRQLVGGGIDLRWSLDPELPTVNADPAQIEQVVLNLVANARDAMPLGGTLGLETARASASDALPHEIGNADLVRLSISDTGPGMSPEVKLRIFEPFFTTKAPEKGTGLGLSTVYGIVRQSGGFITVDSEISKGTTFRVFLPASDGATSGG